MKEFLGLPSKTTTCPSPTRKHVPNIPSGSKSFRRKKRVVGLSAMLSKSCGPNKPWNSLNKPKQHIVNIAATKVSVFHPSRPSANRTRWCVAQKVFGRASVRISCTKVREIRATTGFTANTWHNALIK